MKQRFSTVLALLLASTPVLAANLVNVAGASHVAVSGYDTVAFFTDGEPVNGSPFISSVHGGATYYFATEDHKRLFEQDPDKYAPQYGGFCAFGVGRNALFPVDIDTWQIRDGKLYLNLNSEILKKFNSDFEGNITLAEKYWPELVTKQGK